MTPQTELLSACLLCGSRELEILDAECNISHCGDCGYIFDNPRPTLAALIEFYSKPNKFDDWLAEEGERDDLWIRRLRKFRRLKKEGSVLDVGAGIGQFLHHAKADFTEVAGTEVSRSAVEIAQTKYGLKLYQGTLDDFRPGRLFDNVTLFHVLEHVPDPKALIMQCKALLSPRGVLLICVPNDVQSLKSYLKRVLGRMGVRKFRNLGKERLPKLVLDGSINEIHLSHFRPRVLSNALERAGFEVLENGLDPYYAASGGRRVLLDGYLMVCKAIKLITGINIYDTIWIAAKRRS